MRALDAVLGAPWAIQPDALEQIIQISAREHEVSAEALEKYRAEAVARAETLEQRGSVAILNIAGPLFRRANLFTDFSGATSYDILRRDLQVALDNRDIQSILLNIDSPGGAVSGCGELAKAIHAAEKPVVAYVGGVGASAAYWLASAAREIVVDDAAEIGSIGVILGMTDRSEQDRAQGIRDIEFVSSQSPMKNPDPDTAPGAASYQKRADDLAAVFIAAVAKHRGLSVEEVEQGFGRGGVFVGADAVAAGMVDSVGTFEGTLERLSSDRNIARPRASGNRSQAAVDEPAAEPAATHGQQEEYRMADENPAGEKPATTEADLKAAREEAAASAVAADRERRAAIMALDEAQGREALAEHLYATTDMDAETVKAVLATAPKAEDAAPQADPEADYDRQRAAAGAGLGGLSEPKKPAAKIDTQAIYADRRAQLEG